MIRQVNVVAQVLRFKANSSYLLTPVTRACLYDLLCVFTTLGGSPVLAASARLKRVEIFSAPLPGAAASNVQFNNVELSWTGAPGPNKVLSASGTASMPAHIVGVPPRDSATRLWGDVGAATSPLPQDVLFVISGNAGDIIDVWYDWVPANADTGANAKFLTTQNGGVTGLLNVNLLDSTAPGGGVGTANFIPVLNSLGAAPFWANGN